MAPSAIFINSAGRLRSGWRLGIFLVAFIVLLLLLGVGGRVIFVVEHLLNVGSSRLLEEIIFRLIFLAAAVIAGWLCNYWLEGLPWRALGLSFHSGWWRDLLLGSMIGAVSLLIAALIALVGGGLRFSISANAILFPLARALAGTGALFIIAALAEEAAFRGYPLQTLTRARLAWFGVLLTSLPFAAVHLQNPGATLFSTVNTALAGLWLAAAYLRTRSLWFPLGVHWAWNWTQGTVLGLAVSGLNLSGHTVLQAVDKGPAWLTGGTYGIEGGAACTIALMASTAFIWWNGLISPTPELIRLTSEENPRLASSKSELRLSQ